MTRSSILVYDEAEDDDYDYEDLDDEESRQFYFAAFFIIGSALSIILAATVAQDENTNSHPRKHGANHINGNVLQPILRWSSHLISQPFTKPRRPILVTVALLV